MNPEAKDDNCAKAFYTDKDCDGTGSISPCGDRTGSDESIDAARVS